MGHPACCICQVSTLQLPMRIWWRSLKRAAIQYPAEDFRLFSMWYNATHRNVLWLTIFYQSVYWASFYADNILICMRRNNNKMAFIEMSSLQEAVEALVVRVLLLPFVSFHYRVFRNYTTTEAAPSTVYELRFPSTRWRLLLGQAHSGINADVWTCMLSLKTYLSHS